MAPLSACQDVSREYHLERSLKKSIFYFREVGAGLDSGMTIQVVNDYGHLSLMGNDVFVPVYPIFNSDVVCRFEPVLFKFSNSRIRLFCLHIWRIFYILRSNGKSCVLLLRERKHLVFALIIRFLSGVTVVSELHEGGIPLAVAMSFRRKFQWFLDSVDGVVFTNYSQVHFLESRGYGIPRNHIVLPNGVDTRYFQCAQPAPPESAQVILTYTGQFTPWKNIPLLFESLQYLPEHFRLRIAGGKVQGGSKAYIDGLVKQFHVDGRVDYLGFVAPDQIVENVLSGSSVLLLPLGPSDIAQFATCPMKLVEYMATPMPIVAIDAPSVISLSGSDTVYLSRMNAPDFADAILTAVLDRPCAREERIVRANTRAVQYDHRERARRYDDWLSSLFSQT